MRIAILASLLPLIAPSAAIPNAHLQLTDLPSDIWSIINSNLDTASQMALGMTSSIAHEETNTQNQASNIALLKLRQGCHLDFRLKTQGSGFYLLKDSLYKPRRENITQLLDDQASCIDSFLPKIPIFNSALDDIIIQLPTNLETEQDALSLQRLLQSLQNLSRLKKQFKSISVTIFHSYNNFSNDLDPQIESQLMLALSTIHATLLHFSFRIRSSEAFAEFSKHSNAKTIKFHQSELSITSIHASLSRLKSLEYLRINSRISIETFRWTIFSMKSLKGLSIPGKFLPYINIDRGIEELDIQKSEPVVSLMPIIVSGRVIRKLVLNAVHEAEEVCTLITRNRPYMNLLSLPIDNEAAKCLSQFLAGNSVIKEIEIHAQSTSSDMSFLMHAVALEAFSITNTFTNLKNIQSILFFIASHQTLISIHLRSVFIQRGQFLFFYEGLVKSVRFNLGIQHLTLRFRINCNAMPKSEFTKIFAELNRPLLGRDLFINGIHIDRVVNDLSNPSSDVRYTEDRSYLIG